eukprot:TRINITY_DN83_c0_g1_i2.p1 TRINITY_DN83_c0_g1~~TRINITY_DN83_c0_g1_i2.p1  ORF type:complete len:239 (+),score=58.62 TRINITY_DN83_c0_g1_i2:40-717(+)
MQQASGSRVVLCTYRDHIPEISLRQFFEFCGRVESIESHPRNDLWHTTVTFLDPAAANTSTLLNGAILGGQPITVALVAAPPQAPLAERPQQPIPHAHIPAHTDQQLPQQPHQQPHQLPQRPQQPQQQQRQLRPISQTLTAVVASVAAAGYILGKDAALRLQAIDAEHGISRAAKAKVQEVDHDLRLSERSREFEEEHRVRQRAEAATRAAGSAPVCAHHATHPP